jgi:hypothetical protein
VFIAKKFHDWRSKWKHRQKSDWKLDFPCVSYSYEKCMTIDSLIEYMAPPNHVHN